jgi:hypothetical protein
MPARLTPVGRGQWGRAVTGYKLQEKRRLRGERHHCLTQRLLRRGDVPHQMRRPVGGSQ